jgi:hypothetical protein
VRNASPKLLIAALSLALMGLVLIVYWPTGEFDFVRIDDPDYVWSNTIVRQGLTWPGVQWAFTTGHTGNWQGSLNVGHVCAAKRDYTSIRVGFGAFVPYFEGYEHRKAHHGGSDHQAPLLALRPS